MFWIQIFFIIERLESNCGCGETSIIQTNYLNVYRVEIKGRGFASDSVQWSWDFPTYPQHQVSFNIQNISVNSF